MIRELKAEVKANAKLIKQLDEEKSATDIALNMKEQVIQQLEAEKIASHEELEKKENLIQELQAEKDALQ